MNYHLKLEQHTLKAKGIERWCLDFPRHDDAHSLESLQSDGLVFQGWVLSTPPQLGTTEPVHVFLRQGDKCDIFAPDRERPDVIEKVLGENPANHMLVRCGFRFKQVLEFGRFEFGFSVAGEEHVVVSGEVKGPFDILHGQDNWLFLDNDTNQSVAQHTGDLRLEDPSKKGWSRYFSATKELSESLNIPFALLVAPAKEAVYAEQHPLPRAQVTVMDDMLDRVPDGYPLIYPVAPLQALEERSFRVTDTHWSAPAARFVSELLAIELGLDSDAVREVFASDKYKVRAVGGDLGNKVYPPLKADELVLTNFNYRKRIRYDNGLPNFGRCIVIRNKHALVDKKLVLFGSSSAYSMLNYLYRLFREVVLIHSAGNIDTEVVKALAPDYLAAQTNGRFVVRAPEVGYSLQNIISEKLAAQAPAERQAIIQKANKKATDSKLPTTQYLHNLLT